MSFDASTVAQLRKRIAVARGNSVESLAKGEGIVDFTYYRYTIGYIEAMDQIVKFIDEIQTDLMKG